jgi:glycosyltransferase involved in cell wall biosynthesis
MRRAPGVTLIGYPRAQMGMGEHVRNTAHALASRHIPFSILDFDRSQGHRQGDASCDHWIHPLPHHDVNLLHINADETMALRRVIGERIFSGARYTIGFWAWELEYFPEEWEEAARLVDEIWAPSEFVRQAMRRFTSKPVLRMPLRVQPPEATPFDLRTLSIDEGSFTFLFFFDFNSFSTRKNPDAVIEAFEHAFPKRSSVMRPKLIIKTIGADGHAGKLAELERRTSRDPDIVVFAETLDAAAMSGLLRQADAFVSLHRSEGFGRGLAEAMYYGKPVIGTGYSGNMDFMNAENSYLVDYELVPVHEGDYVYTAGSRWAEPDVTHAAGLMRRVVEHPAAARERGRKAQDFIRKHYSTSAVAAALTDRLATLGVPRPVKV